jgi:GDP-L-fucose synthase
MINKDNRIVITGGTGFVGRNLEQYLRDNGYTNVYALSTRDCDLRNQSTVPKAVRLLKPSCIIHLAGSVGGIQANQKNPGKYFYNNIQIGINVLEMGRLYDIEKVVMIGTVCSYPKNTNVPFREDYLWDGYPEETNAPYGIAKRALIQMGRAYAEQYGMKIVNLIPVNMYGPGDSFDPKKSHVIPALILKIQKALDNNLPMITVWGTGQASREFLYVDDCCQAIELAIQTWEDSYPINIGTGREIQITELVNLIAMKMGYTGDIHFDVNEPEGQPRRCLDTYRAELLLNFKAKTVLEDGLEETIKWFRENIDASAW